MRLPEPLRVAGPGLAMAATGVGAGDLIAAMAAGAAFGPTVLWAVAVGAVLKFALNEGLARWQLATGTTLLEGWSQHLGRPLRIYFMVYLVLWSFLVGGALMSACGVAAHALIPQLSIPAGAVVHSLAAAALVLAGRYALFESLMKLLVGVMVVTLLGNLVLSPPAVGETLRGLLIPRVPPGAAAVLLGLMGGVGGSVTLLAYGYWIRERGWTRPGDLARARWDLGAGYLLTGLFGGAILLLAARALGGSGEGLPPGSAGLLALADALGGDVATRLGEGPARAARQLFLLGVWGAVFTSTLGVWQGVPYLFADFRGHGKQGHGAAVDTASPAYRGYLAYLALAPMVLLAVDRPIWIILTYTVASSTFMPLLAATLLWLNGRERWVGSMKNSRAAVAALLLALAVFAVLAGQKIAETI